MKSSILRNVLFASLGFGLTIGLVFPFFADLFVTWKPGMYGWFSVSALLAGATVGETLGQTTACDDACVDLAGQSAALHEQVARFRVA